MGRITSKDGTLIAFDRVGEGSAILLVDGAMGYRNYFGGRPLAAALSKTFTVIAYDRRGRGESTDTLPYTIEREIEDIEALIDEVGAPVYLYGFSSGSVLALKAAARLKTKVVKLALHEPPFNSDDDSAKQEFIQYTEQMAELLNANKRSEAVTFFLADMLPPDVLEGIKQSPDWAVMEAVAHTLAYDNAVMDDGAVPVKEAQAVTIPTLVLVGSDSPEFKHEAANGLVNAMPHAQRKILEGQATLIPPEILAPILAEFFAATIG